MSGLAANSTEPDSGVVDAVRNNRETVASYERCARDYADATARHPSPAGERALQLMVGALGPAATVLEIGSGPGWEADFLEAQGLVVRRTDVAEAFLKLQRERGKSAEHLDVIHDDLGEPYDGIVALYVLQHIDRALIDSVLGNAARALRPGGAFLVALREGSGQIREVAAGSGAYHVTLWSRAGFRNRLDAAGLRIDWVARATDEDGRWMTFLARRSR